MIGIFQILSVSHIRTEVPRPSQSRSFSRVPDHEAVDPFSLAGFPPDVTTYNLMIHHYGLWNKVDRAEEMFLEMRSKGLRANEDTFVALMGALTRVRG